MDRYPIYMFWSDENEAWVAIAPDLPGCSASGTTPEDALTELHTAIDLWLETAKRVRITAPEPFSCSCADLRREDSATSYWEPQEPRNG